MCGWFFNTQYNLSLPSFVPNFKILGQVVPEKSLTEKKVYKHTNTQTHGKNKNYIPPIYFVYRGYKYTLPNYEKSRRQAQ